MTDEPVKPKRVRAKKRRTPRKPKNLDEVLAIDGGSTGISTLKDVEGEFVMTVGTEPADACCGCGDCDAYKGEVPEGFKSPEDELAEIVAKEIFEAGHKNLVEAMKTAREWPEHTLQLEEEPAPPPAPKEKPKKGKLNLLRWRRQGRWQ